MDGISWPARQLAAPVAFIGSAVAQTALVTGRDGFVHVGDGVAEDKDGSQVGQGGGEAGVAAGTITIARNRVQAGAGTVVENAPKTLSSCRTLPLDDGLISVLKRASARHAEERLSLGAAHADGGYVAVNEAGEAYTPDSLTRMWLKMTKAAGVRPIRLHDARHSCGTDLHLRGVPRAVIAKWLCHADAATTARIYAHSQDDALRSAGQTLGAVVTSS